MRRPRRSAGGAIVLASVLAGWLLAGCTTASSARKSPGTASPSPFPANRLPETRAPGTTDAGDSEKIAGTVVRFTTGSTSVGVTITEDTPTTRDFLSMLPMTLTFEDFHGQEKVATPPRPFDYTGATGITPRVGDLFSYKPWGNLGFFYDVDGLGRSEGLVRLGTTTDLDKIEDLDGRRVTIQAGE